MLPLLISFNTSSIIGIIHLVLFIIALVNIVGRKDMSLGKKLLWILIVLLLPVIGLILYFLLA